VRKAKASDVKNLSKRYGCPVEFALDLLDGKWKPVILARLKERPHRYSELRRLIPNLTDKMLTESLKSLENRGMIERDAGIADLPRRLYRLTAQGESLRPILDALYCWGAMTAATMSVSFPDSEG